MHKSRLIKIPQVKYAEARNYQNTLYQQQGLKLPLWLCLAENEKQQSINNNVKQANKLFKRLL